MVQSWAQGSQVTNKKNLNNLTFCFSIFIKVFDKQANIGCSIGRNSSPMSSHDHISSDQVIAMERYKSFFRKLNNFFSGKQQVAVRIEQKNYSLLTADYCMVLRIFEVATSF